MNICHGCSVEFIPKRGSAGKFCGRSCAVSFNNKNAPKRKLEGSCATCNASISKSRKYCSVCYKPGTKSRISLIDGKRVREKTKQCLSCTTLINDKSSRCKVCDPKYRKNSSDTRYNLWLDGKYDGKDASGLLNAALRRGILDSVNWTCQSPNCSTPGGFSIVHPTTGHVPLEIDHINGNSHDHSIENIIVLCPNCHALTPTYRALNKQSKRTYRKLNN